jgi:hypothetical protein
MEAAGGMKCERATRAGVQDGRPESHRPVLRHACDRVDTREDRLPAACPETSVDHPGAQAGVDGLPTRDHPTLSRSNARRDDIQWIRHAPTLAESHPHVTGDRDSVGSLVIQPPNRC